MMYLVLLPIVFYTVRFRVTNLKKAIDSKKSSVIKGEGFLLLMTLIVIVSVIFIYRY